MLMNFWKNFNIQPGGWLLLALIYFFGDLDGLVVVLGNVLFHEAGHLLLLRRYKVYIRSITMNITGLCIHYNGLFLTPKREFFVALAGPALGLGVSVLTSVLGNLFHHEGLLLFAGVGFVLSGFNLLPAKPLDGWRMLSAIRPNSANSVSVITATLVLFTGLYIMLMGYGTAVAFMGIVLLMQDAKLSVRQTHYAFSH